MTTQTKLSFRRALIAIAGALIANLAIFALASLAGASWQVGQPFPVGVGLVVGATVAPMLLGALVVRAVGIKWPKTMNWFAWGVLTFAVLGSPMGWVSSGETATGLALGSMHIVAGLAWFWALKPAKI